MSSQAYFLWLECTNCGKRKEYEIKKGVEFRQVACHNCGCCALFKL
jgi:hypothetical protein